MCGFDSTLTSLLVCSAWNSTPNDGMRRRGSPGWRRRRSSGGPMSAAGEAGERRPERRVERFSRRRCEPAEHQRLLVARPSGSRRGRRAEVAALVDRRPRGSSPRCRPGGAGCRALDHLAQRQEVLGEARTTRRVGRRVEGDAHLALERGADVAAARRARAAAPAAAGARAPPAAAPAAAAGHGRAERAWSVPASSSALAFSSV